MGKELEYKFSQRRHLNGHKGIETVLNITKDHGITSQKSQ